MHNARVEADALGLDDTPGTAAVCLRAGMALMHVVPQDMDGRGRATLGGCMAVPDGVHLEKTAELYPAIPSRKTGTVELTEKGSFVEYVNEHRLPESRIFAEATTERAVYTAILDYHEVGLQGEAGWCEHRAVLALQRSPEWMRWAKLDGKYVEQVELAEFLEEHEIDIVDPPGAKILEIARTLKLTINTNLKSAHDLTNGNTVLQYEDHTTALAGEAGNVTIPERITIQLRPFVGHEPQEIECLLRYRRRESKVFFMIRMLRVEEFIENVLKATSAHLREVTELPVFAGNYVNGAPY